jgi:hypothetical protein
LNQEKLPNQRVEKFVFFLADFILINLPNTLDESMGQENSRNTNREKGDQSI